MYNFNYLTEIQQQPQQALAFLIPLLASAAGALVNGAIDYFSTKSTNEDAKATAKETYAKERADALTDQRTTNAYNSPAEQMNRLRQAGLNPNLVYGKGADNTAAMVRNTQQQPYSPIKPNFDKVNVLDTLGKYQNMEQGQAQTDNIKAMTDVARKDALLKEIQGNSIMQQTARSKFDLDQADRIKDVLYTKQMNETEIQKQQLSDMKTGQQINIDRNEREKLMNSKNIQKTLSDILEAQFRMSKSQSEKKMIETQVKEIRGRTDLNAWDLHMRKDLGIQPNDPFYFRQLQKFLSLKSRNNRTDAEIDSNP